MASATIFYVLAAVALLHSAYSAYEFSYLVKHISTSLANSQHLPLDIKIEAAIGTVLVTIGVLVSKANQLKPIRFAEAIVEDELAGKGPYLHLDSRPSFVSISQLREEFRKGRYN